MRGPAWEPTTVWQQVRVRRKPWTANKREKERQKLWRKMAKRCALAAVKVAEWEKRWAKEDRLRSNV